MARKNNFFKRVTELKHFIVYSPANPRVYAGSIDKKDLTIGNLFKEIANSLEEDICKLKRLSLATSLFTVDSKILAKVVGSLESVDFESVALKVRN